MKPLLCLLLLILLPGLSGYAQNPLLNEVMSSNGTTLQDEDGDTPDWIEIYNPGPASVDLGGFGLSDDSTDLFRWTFPPHLLPPQTHLLVFASGKDRRSIPRVWETQIDWGDEWRYFVGVAEPPADWRQPGFDDSSWPSGPSGFGYGDGDDATVIPATISCYIRHTFTVGDPATILRGFLHVDYDDAFVAYLNGSEIARANIGTPGIIPHYQQWSDDYREAQIYQGGLPDAFPLDNIQSLLQSGENVLAIQVHNYGPTSSDMTMIPFLTLGMDISPPGANGLNPLLASLLPHMHTNFKIKAEGEIISLTAPGGQLADQLESGYLPVDISLGRQPDGWDNWLYFSEATPGVSNTTSGIAGIAPEPQFSHPGGFYSGVIALTLSANPGDAIHYTLDGSFPTPDAPTYSGAIVISATTVVRAAVYNSGQLPGRSVTHTYFVNENSTLPVISLSTDPGNFFDNDSGIYVLGPNADPAFPYFGANFWQDWERPLHIEMFESDGSLAFSIDAGTKIFGGWSRGHAQKSLSIFARSRYGYSEIDYPVFPDKPIAQYEALVLRNSGNDWPITLFRDPLMTGLLDHIDTDRQAYRPAIVFLNGQYWGIHNIREKVNEHFVAANHPPVAPNRVDFLENDAQVLEGDNSHYLSLLDYITTHNLNDPVSYEYVNSQMEVAQFRDYEIAQVYFDNTDWPGNNIKFWRPQTPGGRWRWILFDTDFGFGIFDPQAYLNNTLAFALETNGPAWPNPPWSTFLLRRMVSSVYFRNNFINRFADLLNTEFQPARVIERIDQMAAVLAPEMSRHYSRWGGSVSEWQANVQVLRDFASNRPSYIRAHIGSQFNLSGMGQVSVSTSPAAGGKVQLNSLLLSNFPWSGYYYYNVPQTLTAIPNPGYRFAGWDGITPAMENPVSFLLNQSSLYITALFEPDSTFQGPVVINEINYNSAPAFDPEDWVEFYNNSGAELDLGGWYFRDEEDIHTYTFPANTLLPAEGYIVLCRDTSLFSARFPGVNNYLGNMGFGLSGGGELLRLYDPGGTLVDFLTYDDVAPWPVEPDGEGPTLALKNPNLDNALPGSWAASAAYGTPGVINDVFVGMDAEAAVLPQGFSLEQNYPNPFNPATVISYQLSVVSDVKLEIYNLLGQKVVTLFEGRREAGMHQVRWDGRDAAGSKVGAGVYFYRLEAGKHYTAVRKMVLLK